MATELEVQRRQERLRAKTIREWGTRPVIHRPRGGNPIEQERRRHHRRVQNVLRAHRAGLIGKAPALRMLWREGYSVGLGWQLRFALESRLLNAYRRLRWR